MPRRRAFLMIGLGLLGAGALGYGGSLMVCAVRNDRLAMLRPLFVALQDIGAPETIGWAWLRQEDASTVATLLLSDTAVVGALLNPEDDSRRRLLSETVQADFVAGRVALADRWLVAQTEARIAAAWLADRA